MSDVPMISTLESFLQLTTARQRLVSTNMANIDTPGYHARDINFQQELNRAVQGSSMARGGAPQLSPVVEEQQGLMERPDGNNVDMDREALLMAETQLQYQMGVSLIKDEFHQIISAINGGN